MPSCVMRFCKNYTRTATKSSGITYHTFPSNGVQRMKWMNVVRKQRSEEDWQPSVASKICSAHFKDEDKYTSGKGLTLLKKTALPCLEVNKEGSNSRASPNSLEHVDISDCEHIFETPKEAYLRQKVKHISEAKDNLMRKNKNLRRSNNRLLARCALLRETVRNLKKQINNSPPRMVEESEIKTEYMISIDGIKIEKTDETEPC